MTEVRVTGADEFAALSRRIKEHANSKVIRRELYSGLNRATKPVRTRMKESLLKSLPKRGGLAALEYRKSGLTTGKTTGRSASVRIKTNNRTIVLAHDTGEIKHPVFGVKSIPRSDWRWVSQSNGVYVETYLDNAFEDGADEVRHAVMEVIDEVSRKVQ